MKTGFVWDERFAWFHTDQDRRPEPFFQPMHTLDTRETKERIRELLVASGLAEKLVAIQPKLAEETDLLRCHTAEYIAKVKDTSEKGGGDVGEGAWIGPNSYDIVRLAAGLIASRSPRGRAGELAHLNRCFVLTRSRLAIAGY